MKTTLNAANNVFSYRLNSQKMTNLTNHFFWHKTNIQSFVYLATEFQSSVMPLTVQTSGLKRATVGASFLEKLITFGRDFPMHTLCGLCCATPLACRCLQVLGVPVSHSTCSSFF